jgi:hypothetical protein
LKAHKINIQSIVDATNADNIDRFLADLRLVLTSIHSVKNAAGKQTVEVGEMSWIDDGVNAGTVAVNQSTHIDLIKDSDKDKLEKEYGKLVDAMTSQFSDMTWLHKERHFLLMACHYLATNNVYIAVNNFHAFIILCEQWLYMEDLIVSAAYFTNCYLGYSNSFKAPSNIYAAIHTDLYHDACAKTSAFDGASFEDIFNNSSCVRLECRTNQGYHYYYAMSFEDWKQLKQK